MVRLNEYYETNKKSYNVEPYWEAFEHVRSLPANGERIAYALHTPLLMTVGDYDNLPTSKPTPLDTENVYVCGENSLVAIPFAEPISYGRYAIQTAVRMAELRMYEQADDPTSEAYAREVMAQIENRCVHNQASFERLKGLVQQDEADDLAESLIRLRTGTASVAEMYEIIKRYPGMGSIQTSNYTRFFDPSALSKAARQVRVETARLGYLMPDVEVSMDIGCTELSDSKIIPGTKVQKVCIGRLIQGGGSIEHMLKVVHIPTAGGFAPCAVSTYLRPANYKDYEGYKHETIDNYPVGVDGLELDDTARMLEGPARRQYLQALYNAAQKCNGSGPD